ncbi:MAG TPA: cytochrome-c oxidase, cbb3-type subunit III [Steroidobacteraceae bacterium]|nr:cytochrome-c oxidase, cbb3-type subunit III [Steroidobacteraceae bacterium]
MTDSHAIFIVVLTLANIGGALWLLWWTRRSRGEAAGSAATTGHVWDEDLTELNNPLPRWWLWLFIITVAFAGVYLVLYPGLGSWGGTLGWSSRQEHATQSRQNAARIERTLAPFAARDVAGLVRDPAAMTIGRNLFLNNCAACHGSDGGGAPGFPNLTDRDWLYGGDADTVFASIANGRNGVMPAWGGILGERGVTDVLDYVFSLQGHELDAGDVRAGGQKFAELCSACHGADARGNPVLGAPNLTDGTWLHGGAPATVRQTIEQGRNGTMPPHLARLGETRVKLLAAYVLSLGAAQEPQADGNAR